MSGFALPTDPEELLKQKEAEKQAKADEAKVAPEQEALHRLIFVLVFYVGLALMVLLMVPTIGTSMLDAPAAKAARSKGALPGPSTPGMPPTTAQIWSLLDQVVKVRFKTNQDLIFTAYAVEGVGLASLLFFVPIIALIAIYRGGADKAAVCRTLGWAGVAIAAVGVALLIAPMVEWMTSMFANN